MGQVLNTFKNGFPGAISRSADDIVISLRNAGDAAIPFGAPVFLKNAEQSCLPFDASASTAEKFLGFAVRAADKTPETYGSAEAAYAVNDPVDILVRGSVVVRIDTNATPGQPVYIRKSDGKLTTQPGAEGSTLLLPNVTVRQSRDSLWRAEVVVRNRNIL